MQFIRDRAQQHRIPWPKPNHPRPDQRRRTVLLVVYKKILHHFPFPVPNAGRSCAHERWIETQTMIKKKAIKKKKKTTPKVMKTKQQNNDENPNTSSENHPQNFQIATQTKLRQIVKEDERPSMWTKDFPTQLCPGPYAKIYRQKGGSYLRY